MAVEAWSEIEGTDYSVSDMGRVMSHKYGTGRILRAALVDGYPTVALCMGGVAKDYRVHRLVLTAFVGPPPTPKHEGNHIDGNRANNLVGNLEWVTGSENRRHRFDVLKHGAARGERHGFVKLTEADVREIRKRRAAGESCKSIAADFKGVDPSRISNIARGRTWAWLPQEI